MSYLLLKHLHISLAGLALLAYIVRGIALLRGAGLASARLMRILPHVIYTALIVVGATLATLTQQWGMAWIWLKLALLAGFIAIGAFAFSPRSALPRARRASLWGMGLVLFLMIFATAAWHHAVLAAGSPPAPAAATTAPSP